MKKILTALVAGAVATTTIHAAQITWRNNSTAFSNDGTTLNGNAIILMMDGGAASWSGSDLALSGGTYLGKMSMGNDGKVPTTNISVTGNWTAGTVNVLGGAAYGEPGTVDAASIGFGTANKHDYYMLIFDTSTITASSKYTTVSLSGKNSTSESGTITLSFAGTDLKTATWTAVSVPEPTTVALLALGLAAVGLKRKVA